MRLSDPGVTLSVPPAAPIGRRLVASLVDAASFLVLPVLLVPLGLWVINRGTVLSPTVVNLIGLVGIVLPATVWAACWDVARGATPGKRLLGLAVVDIGSDRRPRFRATLLRAVIKIAVPWELGHTTALVLSADATPSTTLWVVAVATDLLPLIMIIGSMLRPHRPPHDRLARTRVISVGRVTAIG